MTLNMGFGYIGTAPPPNTTVHAQADQGGGADQLTFGGFGSWIKEWVDSGETLSLSSLGIQPNPALLVSLLSVVAEISNSDGAITTDLLDQALSGLLQEIPIGVLDGTTTDSSGGKNTQQISAGKYSEILKHFFDDLQSVLADDLNPSPSRS